MFAIVICLVLLMCSVYLDHLKFCVVYINGRRCVCCGECYIVSNECDEPTSCLVQPALCNLSLRTVVKLCTFCVLTLGVNLVS